LAPALEDERGPGELFVWRLVADLAGHLEALAEGRGGTGAEDGDASVAVLKVEGALAAIGGDGTDDRAGDGDLLAVEARRGVEDRADGGGGGGPFSVVTLIAALCAELPAASLAATLKL